ncbi:Hypothetical predicted protein [Octopus vulgaris]|uniref:Uncharacterized protein n=1 Tax=Octopus vulgaris TaxID=6645 RepID=A0AA36FIA4_OCTVU|nr:Hypothetical predicted protein [Octopus vulgaris]
MSPDSFVSGLDSFSSNICVFLTILPYDRFHLVADVDAVVGFASHSFIHFPSPFSNDGGNKIENRDRKQFVNRSPAEFERKPIRLVGGL